MSDCDAASQPGPSQWRNQASDPSREGLSFAGLAIAHDAAPETWRAATVALGGLIRADAGDDTPMLAARLDAALGSEEYWLKVSADGIRLRAGGYAGLVYGCVALRDRLPAQAWRTSGHHVMSLPLGEVRAEPQLAWRGAMLDVARHFLPLPDVLRFVDLMMAHRLNRLHLHLSDDQGWRVESSAYPRLNEVGSWRRHSLVGWMGESGLAGGQWDGTPHGGFYSTADLREIVAYAADRAITVVPEIDLPGHSTPLLASLPQLRVPELAGDDDAIGEVAGGWGVFRNVVSPLTFSMQIVAELLGEVADAVPGPYLHVGGDECDLSQWRNSSAVADYIAARGLDGIDGLRADINGELCEMARRLDRRPLVWDEAFVAGGLAQDVIVMVWRSRALAEPIAKAGYDLVLAPSSRTYFDHPETSDPGEPLSIGGPVPLRSVAGWNPLADLTATERLLGVQGQLWSEYIPTRSDLEYAAFPRLSVLAEIAWSGSDISLEMLPDRLDRLTAMGVNFRPPYGPLPWQRGGTGARAAAGGNMPALTDPALSAVVHSEAVGHDVSVR